MIWHNYGLTYTGCSLHMYPHKAGKIKKMHATFICLLLIMNAYLASLTGTIMYFCIQDE